MSRPLLLAVATIAFVLVAACGGAGDDKPRPSPGADDSIQLGDSSSTSFIAGGGFTDTATGANLTNASVSLPGITVIGYGDATAMPDEAIIRLTVGQGEFGVFSGSDSPRLELIDEAELHPVIEALKKQGVDENTISVNTLVNTPYGFGGGSAQITFRWSKPEDLKSIFDVAEDSVRQDTSQGLQNIEVLFTVKECEPMEEQAWAAAIEDARKRAERLADLAGLELGEIVSISEAASAASIYGVPSGCAALEELPSFDFTSSSGNNSASEVEVDASLQVTFALK